MINDRHSLMKAFIAAASLGFSFGIPLPAQASETFPAQVKEHLNLVCVPQCNLCHSSNPGLDSTWATSKLGPQMAANGALSKDAKLGPVLDKMRGLGTMLDVDKNGANDIEDIAKGFNPNLDGEPVCDVPKYGCGAHVAPQSPFSNWGTLLAGVFVGGVGLARIRFRKGKHREKA